MSRTQTERINEKLTIYRRPRSTRSQARIRLSDADVKRILFSSAPLAARSRTFGRRMSGAPIPVRMDRSGP